MQPYRPPHLRGQANGFSFGVSSSTSSPAPNESLPPRPLNPAAASFGSRQQYPPSRPGNTLRAGQVSNTWSRGSGGDLASPAGDIRPMRTDHHAFASRQSSAFRSGTPNGSNRAQGSPAPIKIEELDMEMMQSVSRSGGDGAEGDALKDWSVQEQYRKYIDQRLDKHYSTFSTPRDTAPPIAAVEELESLTSVVLLFRKLREGVVASHRIDAFAVEVFESSAKLAILANHRSQALASLSGLVPNLYQQYPRASAVTNEDESQNIDGLDNALHALSLNDQSRPNGHISALDDRVHFASLLLLYHLVLSSPAVFQGHFEDLTLPSRPTLNAPSSDTETSALHGATSAFVSSSELDTVRRSRKALSADLFDPLKYWTLVADHRVTSYERAILCWASDSVRERAWDMMKKVYLELGIGRAGQMTGLSENDVAVFAEKKGAKIENGRIKLR